MPLAIGNIFNQDWFEEIDGDGVITYSATGKSFTSTSSLAVDDGSGQGTTQNRAYIRQFIQARGGERVTLRVMCRMVSGTGALAIDYPNRGNPQTVKILDAQYHSHWMEHVITAEIGEQIIQQDDSVSVVVGTTLSTGGVMEVSRVNVDLSGGTSGALRTHAQGIIDITKTAGVLSYTKDISYTNAGVLSVATSGTGMLVTTPPVNDTEGQSRWFNPLVFLQVSSTDKYGVTAYPSKFDPTTGSFLVQFSDSTGLLDLAGAGLADGQSISVSFEVKMV